jgi:hypothetical protein
MILTVSDGQVSLLDAMTARSIWCISPDLKVRSAALSPDGHVVVAVSDGQVLPLDAATAKTIGRPLTHKGVYGVAFSPTAVLC